MNSIVEVRFLTDAQSVYTGNEFYPAGATAHFYASQADALVSAGVAKLKTATIPSKESPPGPTPPQPQEQPEAQPVVDYGGSGWTVAKLKAEMEKQGIEVESGMLKADLITALEEAQQ